ncbi:hypothetical protein BJ875DRAFT_437137 [Amylocarpus encephaloides]|uniref:Uncharacterized protein n=1 Tax=Amylocarpus encephaloides TaxID=45428 RepID=A0A9P7YSA8_9HELO|nr:hypothetical protein BJ875DRAFT_437137 [Amylocarpus encephaloides]
MKIYGPVSYDTRGLMILVEDITRIPLQVHQTLSVGTSGVASNGMAGHNSIGRPLGKYLTHFSSELPASTHTGMFVLPVTIDFLTLGLGILEKEGAHSTQREVHASLLGRTEFTDWIRLARNYTGYAAVKMRLGALFINIPNVKMNMTIDDSQPLTLRHFSLEMPLLELAGYLPLVSHKTSIRLYLSTIRGVEEEEEATLGLGGWIEFRDLGFFLGVVAWWYLSDVKPRKDAARVEKCGGCRRGSDKECLCLDVLRTSEGVLLRTEISNSLNRDRSAFRT